MTRLTFMRLISGFAISMLPVIPLAAHAAGDHGHDHDHGHGHEASHVAEGEGLRLLHGWTRATHGSDVIVFVEVENQGADVLHLHGAESDIAESAKLVGYVLSGGQGSTVDLPEVEIDPGSHLDMNPLGVGILLSGVDKHLHENDVFEVHLMTSRGEVHFDVQVEPASATQHRHAGHNH